jgi:molecular chaperone DnaJ
VDDLGDLLGGIFGRGNTRARRPSASSSAQRGTDVETSLHLSFNDAVNGVTTTVNITTEVTCHTCGGMGARPGTAPTVCSVCSGRGVVNDNQGMFSFSQPCSACGGTGLRVEDPCPTCGGKTTETKARQVRVRIPAGVEEGQRIRVKGRGEPGRGGGPPGDLFVIIVTDPDSRFGRSGSNLTLTAPVSFSEATLGATITVPTLDRPVTLKVPAGTRSGQTLRVRGRGVPAAKGVGDLLVTVEVAVPAALTDEQRGAVEALGDLFEGDELRHDRWGEQ